MPSQMLQLKVLFRSWGLMSMDLQGIWSIGISGYPNLPKESIGIHIMVSYRTRLTAEGSSRECDQFKDLDGFGFKV